MQFRLERPTAIGIALAGAASLAACSGSGSSSGGEAASPDNGGSGATPIDGPGNGAPLVEGDIARYGFVTVSDDAGEPGVAIANFYELSASVAPAGFRGALEPGATVCRVTDDGAGGFDTISMGFIPQPDGAQRTPIDAGETILLSSPTIGSYAELQRGGSGPDNFYLENGVQGSAAVPADLQASVTGGVFPAISAAEFADVESLIGFGFGASGTLSRDTTFTWNAGATPNGKVRILATTAGGFFLEDGMNVACLVPDTGSFSFPEQTRDELGADFSGELLSSSRVAVTTAEQGDSLLILVRESFFE